MMLFPVLRYDLKKKKKNTTHQPAYVHGGHSFPGVGLGVESLHRVEAAGAIIASCNIQHAVQHGHPGAATSA